MRVLICGGRDLAETAVWNWLEDHAHELCADRLNLASHVTITHVIQGGASGADEAADQWARASEIRTLVFRANWKKHGKAAGPIRNRRMLESGKPDIVIAFPGGRGTADMVQQAEASGIPVVKAMLAIAEAGGRSHG